MNRTSRPVPFPAGWLGALLAIAAAPAAAGTLPGVDFRSYNGRSGHATDSELGVIRTGFLGAYCSEGTAFGDRRMIYPLDVPDGFELFGVDAWGEDVSASHDLQLRLMESCQPFLGGGLPDTTALDTVASSGSDGAFRLSLFAGQYPVQTATCAYWVEARFAANGAACDGTNVALTRIRVVANDPDVIYRDNFGP